MSVASSAPRALRARSAIGRRGALLAAAAALVIFVPPYVLSEYGLTVAEQIVAMALLALSVDLLYGYLGLPSLGQAAYFGAAGYAGGVLMTHYAITSIWVVLPAGLLVSVGLAAVFGLLALRTAGLYFLLVTFALGQLLAAGATKWTYLQSFGTNGLVGIGFPTLDPVTVTWTPATQYSFVAIAGVLAWWLTDRLTRSSFGQALHGVRVGEQRMRVLGYRTETIKYVAYLWAAALAGLGGQLLSFSTGSVVPGNLDVTYSALAFLMVVVGGRGMLYGALAGAVLVVLLQNYVSEAMPDRWPLILGLVFVAAAVGSRDGLLRSAGRLAGRVGRRA